MERVARARCLRRSSSNNTFGTGLKKVEVGPGWQRADPIQTAAHVIGDPQWAGSRPTTWLSVSPYVYWDRAVRCMSFRLSYRGASYQARSHHSDSFPTTTRDTYHSSSTSALVRSLWLHMQTCHWLTDASYSSRHACAHKRQPVRVEGCRKRCVCNCPPHRLTTFSLHNDDAWLASDRPRNIYVDVADCPSTIRFPTIPSHWPSSVMPVHLVSASIKKITPAFSIKGYPVVGFCMKNPPLAIRNLSGYNLRNSDK
jgi:hypothetical protein